MLLTNMSGGADYLAILSIFALGLSFIASLIVTFIVLQCTIEQCNNYYRKLYINNLNTASWKSLMKSSNL